VRDEITARQIVDRIRKNLGASWKESPMDGFCAGDPDARITGVATSFAPSMETLRRAAELKLNMLIVREHPFFSHQEKGYYSAPQELVAKDPACLAKREFIAKNNLQNWHNLRAEKSLASYDVAHRAVISYVLDLPFGNGKKFFPGAAGLVDKVISGWGVNGVTTFQSGFPLFFSALPTTLSTTFGAGAPRPMVVAGCNKEVNGRAQARLNGWFNTSCFTAPNTFGFGTESRTDPDLRAHGIANFDVSISKTTAITEQVRVQFRTEFFNVFNRTQFSSPGLQQGTPTFGVVTAIRNQPRLVQFAMRLQF
jgi:hypothetical protein